ncbi:MurR/RpiR family transcriptional regulator [Feifania hominis]|uniref:MurR/RpiR family transcriptional regulator n=1 Tax=Feifania hominis TaxID=2763660 RepID=A0A926DBK1_9FIRM|nr:MurR/RpiR family transcriptional regulator [Feifania hominis]MBC8535523.1 MurR/RpiR family transcriptional regulator [Feifania hominis]
MGNDLIKRLESMMPKLSKNQKIIAKYIIDNFDKAAFMTAAKLGMTVGVSESTVVRFAAFLGYTGYPQLQSVLQEYLRSKLTLTQRMEVTDLKLGSADVLSKVLSADIDKIRITREEINVKDFEEVVDLITGARKIYILGVRSASALAGFLGFYFNLLFDNSRLIQTNSVSETFEQMLGVGEGDVVIGISFPRYSKRVIKALQFASDRGAQVVAITDSIFSPLVKSATKTLIARSDMVSFVDSLVAPLSLINALIVAVSQRQRSRIEATFDELERIWDEYDVYEKMGNNY